MSFFPDPRPAAALSPDDSARVAFMADALPPEQGLADERGLMLALHRLRFPAIDIALLAPFVAQRLRATRAALGLDDPREAVAGLFFFLAMASATFFFCFVAPEQAEARECILSTAPIACAAPREAYGPLDWLFATANVLIWTIAVPFSLWQVIVALRVLFIDRRDLREPLYPLAQPSEQFWTEPQWTAFFTRVDELKRHAWHVYIAMGMSGDLDRAPPRRLSDADMGEAFAFAARFRYAPEPIAEGPETTLASRATLGQSDGDEWLTPHRSSFAAA